jgi:hypothetical protein
MTLAPGMGPATSASLPRHRRGPRDQQLDLPWIEVTSTTGKIRYQHDGWLPAASLTRVAAGSG